MYIAASRQFDNVIVWEQRDEKTGKHKIRKFPSIYECYIAVDDWKAVKAKFTQSVEAGSPDSVLQKFLGACKNAIDTTEKYTSMYGDKLYKIKFNDGRQWKQFLSAKPVDLRLWETDIPPELKVLSSNYYKAQDPKLRITFYDIENDYDKKRGFASTLDPYAPINSIAFYHAWEDHYVCYAVPPSTWYGKNPEEELDWSIFQDIDSKLTIKFFRSEAELLAAAVEEIQECDLLSGWNSALFDDPYFAQRVQETLGDDWFEMLSFPGGKKPYFREVEIMFRKQKQVQFDGRITIDYMELFKKFTVEDRDSWNLESVSADHLGERFKKLDYEGTLYDLYRNNFSKFVRYNIRDTEILKELDAKYKFIDLANWMMHYSTCMMKHVLGTVRKAEMAVNNFCWHELNVRVPDTVVLDEQGQARGAYVLVPQRGVIKDLFLIDVNGLYPSCMKSINISPEKFIGQFTGGGNDRLEIIGKTNAPLSCRLFDQSVVTKTAKTWYEWLVEHKYAISGHGTVYNQDAPGIVPMILESWYAKRKEAQTKSARAKQEMKELLNAAKKRSTIGGTVVEGVPLTEEEYAKYVALQQEVDYNDSLSYAFKILQNSYYGAQLNQNFKYYAKVAGESTTATGRCVLEHQIRKGCELLDGDYNVDPVVDDDDPRALRHEPASPSLIYGDTDSCIFTLSKLLTGNETLSEKIKIADTVADVVNRSFPDFMMAQFLVQPEFSGKIRTGREIYASAAFFVSKKRYVMHVVDKEGIPKDTLKLMGLDAKKTTTPRPVKEFLRTVCYDLLTGKPENDIDQYIMKYRDAIIDDIPLMEMGLPKGVKKVELYTDAFYDHYKTRLPGHVAASILYNEVRNEHGDTTSLPITSGMKIKVFNFKYEIEHRGRLFNSIALPTDTEEIPDWFTEKFVPIIDREKHAKKLVDNMLHNMFDSIPRHVPTRHQEALNEEFDWV
jgi:DNA polymerase elongation subunit (family B)